MNKLLKIVIKQGNRRRDILSPNVFEFTSNKLVLLPSSKIQPHKPLLYQFKERLQLMFLPKDYPLSVTKEYLPYTIYNFFNSTLSTIIGTLSMQALLQALGASQSISIALSATTNWIIKDGVGLLGGVIYASSVSDKFDSHPKRYKFLSTLLIQISCVLELITPLFPVLFLPLASASNIGKNIGWLAASASRAAFHNAFTKIDNLGDVTAKAGAQNTTAGLIGTGSGIILSFFIGADPIHLLLAFIPLSSLNIWTAYMATNKVVTRSINNERADYLFMESFNTNPPHAPSTESVALKESFVTRFKSPFKKSKLLIDLPLEKQVSHFSRLDVTYFVESLDPYRVIYSEKTSTVYLWYMEDADSEDVIKGVFHASYMRFMVENGETNKKCVVTKSGEYVSKHFDHYFRQLDSIGWHTHSSFISDHRARISIDK